MGGEDSDKIIRIPGETLLIKLTSEEEVYRSKYLPDPKTLNDEKFVCTVCSLSLASSIHKGKDIYVHRALHVLVCEACYNFYGDGCFSADEDGDDKYCRWCGQGGTLYLCSTCNCAFCQKCVKQNLKPSALADLENDDWKCYICNPRPLFGCRTICWGAEELNKIGKTKELEKIKKQKERLEKLEEKKKEENGRKSRKVSTSSEESSTKKRKKPRDSSSSSPEVMPKKKRRETRSSVENHNGSINRSRKKRNQSSSDESEDDRRVSRQSRNKGKRNKKHVDSSLEEDSDTKSKSKKKKGKDVSDESSDDDKKRLKKKSVKKKVDSSDDESSDEKSLKKKRTSRKKKEDSSDSSDDKQKKKKTKKKKKETSSEESSDDTKKKSKTLHKKKKKESSEEDESDGGSKERRKAKDNVQSKKNYDNAEESGDVKGKGNSKESSALVKKRIKLAILWLNNTVKDISELGSLISMRATKFCKKKINSESLKSYEDVLNTVNKLKQLISGVHSNYEHIEQTLDSQLKPWKNLTGLEEPENEKTLEGDSVNNIIGNNEAKAEETFTLNSKESNNVSQTKSTVKSSVTTPESNLEMEVEEIDNGNETTKKSKDENFELQWSADDDSDVDGKIATQALILKANETLNKPDDESHSEDGVNGKKDDKVSRAKSPLPSDHNETLASNTNNESDSESLQNDSEDDLAKKKASTKKRNSESAKKESKTQKEEKVVEKENTKKQSEKSVIEESENGSDSDTSKKQSKLKKDEKEVKKEDSEDDSQSGSSKVLSTKKSKVNASKEKGDTSVSGYNVKNNLDLGENQDSSSNDVFDSFSKRLQKKWSCEEEPTNMNLKTSIGLDSSGDSDAGLNTKSEENIQKKRNEDAVQEHNAKKKKLETNKIVSNVKGKKHNSKVPVEDFHSNNSKSDKKREINDKRKENVKLTKCLKKHQANLSTGSDSEEEVDKHKSMRKIVKGNRDVKAKRDGPKAPSKETSKSDPSEEQCKIKDLQKTIKTEKKDVKLKLNDTKPNIENDSSEENKTTKKKIKIDRKEVQEKSSKRKELDSMEFLEEIVSSGTDDLAKDEPKNEKQKLSKSEVKSEIVCIAGENIVNKKKNKHHKESSKEKSKKVKEYDSEASFEERGASDIGDSVKEDTNVRTTEKKSKNKTGVKEVGKKGQKNKTDKKSKQIESSDEESLHNTKQPNKTKVESKIIKKKYTSEDNTSAKEIKEETDTKNPSNSKNKPKGKEKVLKKKSERDRHRSKNWSLLDSSDEENEAKAEDKKSSLQSDGSGEDDKSDMDMEEKSDLDLEEKLADKWSPMLDSSADSTDSDIIIKKRKRQTTSGSDSDIKEVSEEDKKKKKRKRIKCADSSDELSESDGKKGKKNQKSSLGESPGKGGRKNIKKIKGKDDLAEATIEAAEAEKERRKRIEDRQKLFNQVFEVPEAKTLDKLVLDFDAKEKKELVTVHEDLVAKMKPHQAKGVKFMWDSCFETLKQVKNKKGSGCILAHCMGLGKTFQVISLVHTVLSNEDTNVRTVMVVCPLSTVLNWHNEFDKWLEDIEGGNDIEVFHLTKCKQNADRARELRRWQHNGGVMIMGYEMFRNLACETTKKFKAKMKKDFLETLIDPGADLIVCDEGHMLKNEATALSKAMSRVKTLRRIVLTGTPMQNNLTEYHCMVQFVKPNLLGTKREFLNRFVNPITNGQFVDSTDSDVKVMKRRAHVLHNMLEGLVQRFDYNVLTPFLPPKHEYVISLCLSELQVNLYRRYLEDYSQQSNSTKAGSRLFQDWQALGRIWTHPRVLKMSTDKANWLREKKMMEESEDDEEGSLKDFIDDSGSDSETTNDETSDDKSSDDKKQHIKKSGRATRSTRSSAKNFNLLDSSDEEKEATAEVVEESNNDGAWWSDMVEPHHLEDINQSAKLVLLFAILRECEMIEDKVLVFSQSLFSLDLIEYFLDKIDEANQENKHEEHLGNHQGTWSKGLDYFRLDGSTSSENRNIWCKAFNREDNSRARLFLISTRAGGLGINLTAANRVIIFDASWNPSHDVQSIFRIYRFGQKKPCYVYRFIASGTMEEKVYDRQIAKQSMSNRVVDEQQVHRHFSMNDLNELYSFTPPSKVEDRQTFALPKDVLLAELLKQCGVWIEKYHEHDSLLENVVEEELNEEERKLAWEDYENDKKGNIMSANAGNYTGAMNNPMTQQIEYMRQKLKTLYPEKSEQELNQILVYQVSLMMKQQQQMNAQAQASRSVPMQGQQMYMNNNMTQEQMFNLKQQQIRMQQMQQAQQATMMQNQQKLKEYQRVMQLQQQANLARIQMQQMHQKVPPSLLQNLLNKSANPSPSTINKMFPAQMSQIEALQRMKQNYQTQKQKDSSVTITEIKDDAKPKDPS